MYCRNCGSELEPGANFCPSCGFSVEGGPARAANQQTNIMVNHKSNGLALILAIIITGAGHMYAGKVKDGIILLILQVLLTAVVYVSLFGFAFSDSGSAAVAGLVVTCVVGLIMFGVWIYSIVDCDKVVKEYNARLMETGNPPW